MPTTPSSANLRNLFPPLCGTTEREQPVTAFPCPERRTLTNRRRRRRWGPLLLPVAAAERVLQLLHRARELARDHPDLVRVALGDLREHRQVLVRQQLRVRVAVVDGREDGVDRLGLTLGVQHLRLSLTLRAQDGRLLLALGGEDLRLLYALGGQDRSALVAVRAHLLLHRLLDRRRRVDGLQLDAVDADAPLAGRLVEHATQLGVDAVARRQRVLERHAADHVSQRRHGQLL